MATPDPRRSIGAHGEQVAAEHLMRLGYEILDRNFRSRWGELDIIARDGRTLVFCEVKARCAVAAGRSPFESIHPAKRTRVRRMAGRWLAASSGSHPYLPEIRFDAIGICFDRTGRLTSLEHLEGAF
jgi:putative endonuclease